MSQGRHPCLWLGSGMHSGASDGNREDRRSNTFRGSPMSSCLAVSNVSAHGMFRRENSGGKCVARSWKHRQTLWEVGTGYKNLRVMRIDHTVESGEGRVRRMGRPEAEERVPGSPDVKGVSQRKETQRETERED